MKVVAIINPISGAGADSTVAAHRAALLTEALRRRGLTAPIHLTQYAGHAHALARAAASDAADLVIVWGGDGTVNEAGAALLQSRCALGVIPAGSGNGLAAALGSPREPRAAIAAALDGRVRAIDAGVLDGRPFFNIAGIGVDARIARLFNARAKGTRGRWPYIRIGIREGWRYCCQEYTVVLDGEAVSVRALLIAFANGGEYGNGVRLSARARLDDGLLDALVVEDRPVATRFWHARHLAAGTADRAPRVRARQIRHAVVSSAEPIEYHVDGEPGTASGAVEVTVQAGALLVRG
ncbi:MAG TPA: YegS/Rv2252/BmrU family lipid kinase [Thermoanaerobaculia bacterium]|nr:YegS/Rv2252/BmrU family lipid kinase [Thermoanaerobaculia bacterium]